MPPTRHTLDPDMSNRALGFPALITGLCQSFGVPVTPSKVIQPPITRAFIEKYCMPRQAQGDAPQAADAPPPPHQADPAGSLGMERYLQHLVRQQAANHRGQVQIHECLYQLSLSSRPRASFPLLCPTPDQFRAKVAWPGDWPEAQAGEAPAEAPGDVEEARMDEEMTYLLGFILYHLHGLTFVFVVLIVICFVHTFCLDCCVSAYFVIVDNVCWNFETM
ncbi:hypothetical protein GmHk_14G041620 [Glycine max]|nr:hypothetical protein GmHk_14G041620 [Glycine max]